MKKKGKGHSWKSTRTQDDMEGQSGGYHKNEPVEKFGNKGVKK
jgi:hypothetical protein